MHRRHALWFVGMIGCSFDDTPNRTHLDPSSQNSAQMVDRVVRDGGQPTSATRTGLPALDAGSRDAAMTIPVLPPTAAGAAGLDPTASRAGSGAIAGASGSIAAGPDAAAPQVGGAAGNPALDAGIMAMPPIPSPPTPVVPDPSATVFINQVLFALRATSTSQDPTLVAWLMAQASTPDIDTASGLATLLTMISDGIDCSAAGRQVCLLTCQWAVSRCNVCLSDDGCLSALQETCGQTSCGLVGARSP
jgi:hypothetical protein